MTPLNFHLYQVAQLKTKETINAAKKKGWEELCQKIGSKNSTPYAWNIIKKLKNPHSTETKSEMANNSTLGQKFMQCITPAYVPSHAELKPPTIWSKTHPIECDFNITELNKALKSKSKDTSPGADGITYSMIKNLPPEALDILLNLYNHIWNNVIEIPRQWKSFKIVALLKPGKEKDKENSYRPISLIPCFIKIFNTMVKNRLVWLTESLKIIPDTQYAFRKNLGCADYLVHLTSNIQTALTHSETTILAALDISGAYDNVHLPTLWTKMYIKGIPNKFIIHCYKWLTNRELTITFPDYEITRTSCRGIPQGSVLSPLLFAIYISDINQGLPMNVKSLQYADDVTLFLSGKNYDKVQTGMQNALHNISQELQALHLELNPNKSVITIFTRKRSLTGLNQHFHLDGQSILVQDKIKLLGVTIDNKLNFKQHIEQLYLQCQKDLNILKMITCGRKGANPDYVLKIYKSLIRSKMDYCSFIYGHASRTTLNKLDIIQNQALRIALGAFRTTPVIAMQVESAILPLQLRRDTIAERLIYKIMISPTHPAFQSLIYLNMLVDNDPYWSKKKKPLHILPVNIAQTMNPIDCHYKEFTVPHELTLPLELIKIQLICNTLINYKVLNKTTNDMNLQQEWHEMINITYKNKIIVYTDGSKTTKGTGAAIYIPTLNVRQKFKLDYNTSSYTAEMYAIFKAVQFTRTFTNKDIVICSDCQSVITAIENASYGNFYGSGIILDILKEIIQSSTNKYILQWVPGHAGIKANEEVDKLAKDSVNEETTSREFYISRDDFKAFQNKRNTDIIMNNLIESNKAQWYKQVNSTDLKTPWYKGSDLSRNEIVNICRIRLGHANINTCLHRINCYFTPLCLNCTHAENETLEHLFLHCPKYSYEREKCFSYTKIISNNFTMNFKEIISMNKQEVYIEINNFLRLIKKQL